MIIECSRRESNPELALRRRLFYPLNYENRSNIVITYSILYETHGTVNNESGVAF